MEGRRAPSSAERIELGRQSCGGALFLLLVREDMGSSGENLTSQDVHFLPGHFRRHRV